MGDQLLLLPRLPVLPVISKWTKLGLALDFWLVGCVHSVLSLVLRAAQQGLHYPQQVLSAGEDIGGALLGAEEGGVSWQQLAGSRLERTIRLAEDEQQHVSSAGLGLGHGTHAYSARALARPRSPKPSSNTAVAQ
jgi:hypothetical protein